MLATLWAATLVSRRPDGAVESLASETPRLTPATARVALPALYGASWRDQVSNELQGLSAGSVGRRVRLEERGERVGDELGSLKLHVVHAVLQPTDGQGWHRSGQRRQGFLPTS